MKSPSKRQAILAEQHRRWAAWAATAITDTPPEIFAGQPLDPGSEAAMHCGGAQVAPDNLWWIDGELVTEHEWSVAEHADDPPEWATWPPARRAGRSDAPS